MSAPVLGIDLGTTNTVVAAVQDGQAAALGGPDGEVLIPSVVSFHPSGSVLVGSEARSRRKIDAKNTIYSVKRLIGRSWDSEEVQLARQRFPFEMREGPGQAALVVARKETYTLPEISAFVLRKAKTLAETALGTAVERAVITVPANFNDLQRAATKVAGRVAGLEVMRILNEPTAAALAYGYGKASSERIAVYDFGGGTLDITLLDLSDNVFEVLATAGNTFLGGDDIDHAISDRIAEELLATHRVDAKADPGMLEQLRAGAEEIKKKLSTKALASITLNEIAHQVGGRAIDFSFAMTRSELEQLIAPIVAKTFDVCREALELASLGTEDFGQVLLVGGSTRIPLVRQEVERFFKLTPITKLNPDEVVAVGAAIQANALSGAEKRRSALPPPPKPVSRARLSSHPGARDRQASMPPQSEAPASPAVDTASYGRPKLRTAPGLQPGTPAALSGRPRVAPLVVPPAGGQPSSGVPRTADRGVRSKRTTATGLGGVVGGVVPPQPANQAPSAMVRTNRGLGEPLAARSVPSATLKSAATDAARAKRAVQNAGRESRVDREPPRSPDPSRPTTGASWDPLGDFLDTADLEELPAAELADFDDDEEVTRAREQPTSAEPAPPPLVAAAPADHAPVPPWELDDNEPTRALTREPSSPLLDARPNVTAPLAPLPSKAEVWGSFDAADTGLELPTPGIPSSQPPPPQGLAGPALPNPLAIPAGPQYRPEPPLLIDVTPLTLSVETVGGYCDTVIERNSPIPCEKSRQFATVMDNQESVRVRVSQGEHTLFAQNTLLGEVLLSGLRAAPRGGVTIEVQFALDPSGMLNVNATDLGTGHSVSTRIRLVGLSELGQLDSLRARHAALPMR